MQARQGRGEIRQERQDTVPPLRRDNFRKTEKGLRADNAAVIALLLVELVHQHQHVHPHLQVVPHHLGEKTVAASDQQHHKEEEHWRGPLQRSTLDQHWLSTAPATTVSSANSRYSNTASSVLANPPTSRSELLPTTILQIQPAQLFRRVRAWRSVAL